MKALILVDIQNDFLPGGALAVKDGDKILPVVKELMEEGGFDKIVATKDWHPEGHGSFASTHQKNVGDVIDLEGLEQILWPDHCIQGSEGADIASYLDHALIDETFNSGVDKNIDSYSGFIDNGRRRTTGLDDYLKKNNINDLTIVGLATDYCVKYTVLDACRLGYNVTVIADGCRAINLQPNDSENAYEEMRQAGAVVT